MHRRDAHPPHDRGLYILRDSVKPYVITPVLDVKKRGEHGDGAATKRRSREKASFETAIAR